MSKVKLGFSFLLTFLLMGMFSIVAFAAVPNTPTGVKWTDDGTSLTIRWKAVSGATNYKIFLNGTEKQTSTSTSANISSLAEKTQYDIEVTAVNTDEESGKSTIVKATTGTGAPTHNVTLNNNLADDDSDFDNGMINDNNTGSGVGGQTADFNNVIKSDDMVKDKNGAHGTQRTHGSYMNNTNSCASCHQTHTGASKNLLFKDGEYATCTACHDGTLGFYNVFTGSNSSGTFGGTHDGNMSVHLANGTVELKAAPGGKKDATSGSWTEEFTCASCHAPHGSYSDRLLHENPNDMGNTLVKDGGKRLENVPVVTDISSKVSSADVTYKDATGANVTINYVLYRFDIGTTVDAAYSAKGLTTGDTVLQLMKWNGTKYINDTDPWLHGYEFDESHTKHYWSVFKDNTGKEVFDTDQLKKGEILGSGFAAVPASKTALVTTVKSLVSGNVARGYVVKLDVSSPDANNVTTTTVSSLWASKKADGSNNPGYIANRGVAMSTFCSACHTDYLAGSGKETGTFGHAYRHTTTSDSYTCVRCHYAHGTDVTVMRDSRGFTYDQIMADTTNYFPSVTGDARTTMVKDYLTDKNPSSALKRYTNMAVCWACHTSSHSEGTRNTDTYQYNPAPGVDSDRNGIEFDY